MQRAMTLALVCLWSCDIASPLASIAGRGRSAQGLLEQFLLDKAPASRSHAEAGILDPLKMLARLFFAFANFAGFNPSSPPCGALGGPGSSLCTLMPVRCLVPCLSSAPSRKLRFGIGDEVYCRTGPQSWSKGTIVALNYNIEDSIGGNVVPYQIKLDAEEGGRFVFAPADTSLVVCDAADGPPGTPSIPKRGNAGAALQALEQEMATVRELSFVQVVEGPRLMPVAEHNSRLFVPTNETGPWLLIVRIQGTAAYNSSYRLHLKFNAGWPKSPAEVRFCGNILHAFVYNNGLLETGALAAASAALDPESSVHSICTVLRSVHLLLSDPQALWRMQRIEQFQYLNAGWLQIINEYRSGQAHADLYDVEKGWRREWFHPELLAALDVGTEDALRSMVREEAWDVYSFPLFTSEFCEKFIEEIYNFYSSGLPANRPNTMNNYGVIVNDIGMEPMIDLLQRQVLQPLAHALFPGLGSLLTEHHSFIVKYKVGEDLGLDMHTDDSDVTFNVCLGKEFKGAGLQFCGNQAMADHRKKSLLYFHEKGRCVMHLGHRRHGADDILEGERLNLIFWNRNSEYRKTDLYNLFRTPLPGIYESESDVPDKECLSFTHDRDYGVYKEYTAKTEKHKGQGWCPPPHAEYAGFKTEISRFTQF